MNYIKEINAFYDYMERNPLSASAVTLWHTLMHINNKARWVKTFTVAAPVIRLKSGLKESSFKRARTELKEKGYIDFQSRSRNQAPVYRMVRLSGEYDAGCMPIGNADSMAAAYGECGIHTGNVEGEDVQAADTERIGSGSAVARWTGVYVSQQPDSHSSLPSNQATDLAKDEGMDHLIDQDASLLIKQKENKKKKDNTITADSAMAFYQENFSVMSPYVSGELILWVNHIGDELVLHAMKRALDRGKASWGYVRAILENWREKGIGSVEEAHVEEERFRRKSMSRGKARMIEKGAAVGEVVPEWFWERKKEKRAQQQCLKKTDMNRDVNGETEEIRRMLMELG